MFGLTFLLIEMSRSKFRKIKFSVSLVTHLPVVRHNGSCAISCCETDAE